MEFIKINEEKVKIMLSPEDMAEYNISCDMLESSDIRGREAFRKILRAAGEQCGFVSCGRRIFVQVFPSKKGGCEMFVTSLSEAESESGSSRRSKAMTCYAFKSFNNLLAFCRAASGSGIAGGEVYTDTERSCYYLCLEREAASACEFGGVKCTINADAYIKEHCSFVIGNAIERLKDFG